MNKAARNNIFMMMTFTVVFSLLGYDIKDKPTMNTSLQEPARILVGGAVAGVFLLALAHAGEAGAQLGQGLAVVSGVTAIFVYGGPVWSLLGGIYGNSTPTTPTISTPTTKP